MDGGNAPDEFLQIRDILPKGPPSPTRMGCCRQVRDWWMDRWVDGWMNGWIDESMDG